MGEPAVLATGTTANSAIPTSAFGLGLLGLVFTFAFALAAGPTASAAAAGPTRTAAAAATPACTAVAAATAASAASRLTGSRRGRSTLPGQWLALVLVGLHPLVPLLHLLLGERVVAKATVLRRLAAMAETVCKALLSLSRCSCTGRA